MKKAIVTPLLLLFVLCVTAQKKQHPFLKNSNLKPQVTSNRNVISNLKSAAVTKYRFDSIVSENSWKETYSYNYLNQLVSDRGYEWSNGNWVGEYRTDYTFDANGNNTSETEYSWSSISNNWKENSRRTYEYNTKNKVTTEYEYQWYGSQWVYSNRKLMFYNAAGDTLLHTEEYNWDEFNVLWLKNNNEINYYSNNRLDSVVTYFYYNQQSSPDDKEIFTYYPNGKIKEYIQMNWSNGWVNQNKSESKYTANNDLTESISFKWNSFSGEWDAEYNEVYLYDAQLNMNNYSFYVWNTDSSKFLLESNALYTFNNSQVTSDLILPFYFYSDETAGLLFRHALLSFDNNMYEEGKWVSTEKSVLYYSDGIQTKANTLNYKGAEVFPNPAAETITFGFPVNTGLVNIKLYDATGKCILVTQMQPNHTLDIRKLSNGLYYYQATQGSATYNGKFKKE